MDNKLIIMGYIYNPDGFDWMNFKMTEDNPYTFHHIVEKRYGGKKVIENGALLTYDAHKLLNILDSYCPDAYDDLQEIFKKINGSGEPQTYEIMKEVDNILQKVFCTEEYRFTANLRNIKRRKCLANLEQLREEYLECRKELVKCLE